MIPAALALVAASSGPTLHPAVSAFDQACIQGEVSFSAETASIVRLSDVPNGALNLFTYLPAKDYMRDEGGFDVGKLPREIVRVKDDVEFFVFSDSENRGVDDNPVCAVLVHAEIFEEAGNFIRDFVRGPEVPDLKPDETENRGITYVAITERAFGHQFTTVRDESWTLMASTQSIPPANEGEETL
ncbi:hypothetical protein [Croceicoccus sp. Ery5]|uniref:hypothetical protein n=1 Tax=Croceicoccus sp. Ery5 TaxID=1703340 RepID=UPI001E3B1F59|nr:hypothetical protein [Croceicoccus sp. Ery5]